MLAWRQDLIDTGAELVLAMSQLTPLTLHMAIRPAFLEGKSF